MQATNRVIALTAASETFYLTPAKPFSGHNWGGITWTTANGTALTPVRSGWHKAAGLPQDITARRAVAETLTGYRLRDPDTESVKFPATLTVEEFNAKTDAYDDRADWPGYDLYERVTQPNPDETTTFPAADMLVIDDEEPAPRDGLAWTVNIRDELRQHTELFHLFPGHLIGFRTAFIDAVKALPFMQIGMFRDSCREDSDRPGHVVARRDVPYEPHNTRFVRDIGRSGKPLKTGRHITEAKTLAVSLPVPDRIPGNNRAEAVAVWQSEMVRLLGVVTEALTPAPCWHCRGTGVVAQSEVPAGDGRDLND